MTERVIAGVKVPLVGDDERMHRAINRSIDDLKKLKTEIASTGVATAKQAREVMVLEERISSMVRAQDKASSTFGSGASRLGQMKEKVSSVAGAMSGLAGSVGQAGGALGRFSSVGAQVFGSLAVGGPVAAGVLAVGAGVALLGQHMSDTRAKAEAFGTAMDEAILTRRQESIAALEALREKVAAIGKTAGQASKDLLEMKRTAVAADAIMGRGHLAQLESRSMSHGMNKPPWYASAEAKIAWQQEKQRLAEAIESQKKMVAFDTQTLADLDEQIKLTAIVAADEGKRAAAAHKTQKAHEATVQALVGQKSIVDALWEQRKREGKVRIDPTNGGMFGVGIASGASTGGPMGPLRATENWTYGQPDPTAWTKGQVEAHELEKAVAIGGRKFGLEAFKSFTSGGGMGALNLGAGSSIMSFATQVSSAVTDAISDGFSKVAAAAGAGLDFLLGSSKLGGLGGTGSQAAAGAMSGAFAMSAGTAAMPAAWPMLPLVAAGGAGAAGGAMMADTMMRATVETQSYAKAMRAMNGIFAGAVQVMEPVFDSFMPAIGVVGLMFRNLAQTIAPMNAAFGDMMGGFLFESFRGMAHLAVNVAITLDGLHLAVMGAVNAFNFAMYSFYQNTPGMGGLATAHLSTYNMGVAALNTQVSRHEDLVTLRGEIEEMTIHDARGLAEGLAGLGEETDTLADGFNAVSASMRNIPDFFNVARARRDSGATSTAPGGPANIGAAGEMGATTGPAHGGFSVQDGGLYVNTLVVPSENPQQLAMRLMHASYTTSGRQVGSGEPSRTSSYRNGDY